MTMQLFFDILAIGFLLAGLFFMFVGALGVVRLPDAYHRLHAASKCSTLGLMGLVAAAMCHVGTLDVMTKSIAVVLFAFVATPVGSHMLAKAAHRDGAEQWKDTLSDELAEDKAKSAEDDEAPGSKKKARHRAA
ncbi:MAG: monovalent cation/H(+) antiporter subunit G [Planctomycetota bacterium]